MEKHLSSPKTLLFFCLIIFSYFYYVPFTTQDGPNHKKVALILSRLDHSPAEQAIYENNLGALHTNQLFPLLYKPISSFITVDHYERIFVAIFMMLLVGMYAYFLKTWCPPSFAFWPCILPLCFHPLFLMGMYNFLASVSLSFLALAWLKNGIQHKNYFIFWILFSLLCWTIYLAHPFPFFIFPLCLLLFCFDKASYDLKKILLFSIPVLFFLLIGFLIPLLQNTQNETGLPYKFNSIPELVGGLLISNFSGYTLFQILMGIPFLGWMIYLAKTSYSQTANSYKKFWICLLAIYCIFPNEGNQGAYLNNRFLPYIWAFIPLGLDLKKIQQKWILAPIFLWLTFSLLTFFGMKKVSNVNESAKLIYQSVPDHSRVYPINFNTQGTALNFFPFMHLWANYPDSKHIFSPYLFAHSHLMPLHRIQLASSTFFPATREDFPKELESGEYCEKMKNPLDPTHCEDIRQKGYETILTHASYYDYLFIYHAPSQFLKLLEEKYDIEKVAQMNDISLWHNKAAKPFSPNPW